MNKNFSQGKKIFQCLFMALIFSTTLQAQTITTRDGIEVGDRKMLIDACVEGMGTEYIPLDETTVPSQKVCACLVDIIIPKLTLMELTFMDSKDEDMLEKLLDKYSNELLFCLKDEIGKLPVGKYLEDEDVRKQAIEECVEGFFEEVEHNSVSTERVYDYCSCAVDAMIRHGFSFNEIFSLDDESSTAFNEIILSCLSLLMSDNETSLNSYNPSDIQGSVTSIQVPLVNYLNLGSKIKLTIGGIDRYYLFDTGASDLLLNQDFAQELFKNGTLTFDDFLGKQEYQLADGSTIEAQVVMLNNVIIGDYTVNNVKVAIVKEGGDLCGIGFLKKFKNWEIQNGNTLILYK